ncbi:MAG: hypothetical protein ACE5HF_06180 [Gemmatimonadota bacterium]
MKRLLDLTGMSVGGWIGWFIGAKVSFFTAYMAAVVGAAAGLYVTRRFLERFLS